MICVRKTERQRASCALTHITSAAESLWYPGGLDRLWYLMAKLVHQDNKPVDKALLQGVSVEQENLLPHRAVPFLAKLAIGYHNLSTLTHRQDHESEKQETVQRSSPTVCTSGPKDVFWFSNGTKDAHMWQCRLYPLPSPCPGSASQAERWTGYGSGERAIHLSNHTSQLKNWPCETALPRIRLNRGDHSYLVVHG